MSRNAMNAVGWRLRTTMALAGGAVALAGPFATPIGVDNLALDASLDSASRTVRATIGTAVRTPVGRLGVSGHAQISYSCDGDLQGTVEYSGIVRAMARLRGLTLVREVNGTLAGAGDADCVIAADTLAGRFTIADSTVTGTVRTRGVTRAVTGFVRSQTPRVYDAAVTLDSLGGDRRLTLQLR